MCKLRKIACFLLAGAMMLGAVACQQGGTASSTPSDSGSSAGEEGGLPDLKIKETNQYGYEVTEEPIKFSYYYAEVSDTDINEESERLANVNQILKDEFNLEIEKIQYKQDETERLNLMLQGNNYPECIVGATEAMANTFIEQE